MKLGSKEKQVKIVIDGMTGVGKSTLVKMVSEKFLLEPYEEIFLDENKLLHKFFRDREKWAFSMQVNFLTNRFRQYKEASSIGNVVMDRSIYSDDIFARMYLELGYLAEEEYDVYQGLLQSLLEELPPPSLMVFLKVEGEEAIRRIRARGRKEELEVENSYWLQLNNFYSQNYSQYQKGKLLTLDVTRLDFVNNERDRSYILNEIGNALSQT